MTIYHAGSKKAAIIRMADHAIRDQETLIDAYRCVLTTEDSDNAKAIIDQCKKNIADYNHIKNTGNAS